MAEEKSSKKQAKYTGEDLKRLQSYPLWRKVQITKSRILEFQREFENKTYISFSAGKDSTVLLHIAREVDPNIPAVFVDTGLEYPEVRKFALSQENVIKLKPKMSFREVVDKYGYPLISKETANNIEYARKALENGNEKMYHRYVDGVRIGKRDGKEYCFSALSKLGFSILGSDIKVSSRCCYIMKKSPCRKYEKETGRKPITGIMADESTVRRQWWLQNGCNIFEGNHPRSNPMSFWTEQDVLQYIVTYNLPYASVYGEIKQDENGNYYTTGCKRTGCYACLFGVHKESEPNRFQLLHKTHPKIWEFCMRDFDDRGLGEKKILEFMGVKTGENETDTENQNSMSDL